MSIYSPRLDWKAIYKTASEYAETLNRFNFYAKDHGSEVWITHCGERDSTFPTKGLSADSVNEIRELLRKACDIAARDYARQLEEMDRLIAPETPFQVKEEKAVQQ